MIWRLRIFGGRLLHFLLSWPKRLLRFCFWTLVINSPRGKHSFYRWCAGVILLITDLTPVSLLYETIMDFIKTRSRTMSAEEISIARSVFGENLPLQLVSMDTSSWPVLKRKATAYVSFHTINFDQSLPPSTLIHELVHIWQYERYGSVYISEAIWAQQWGEGYDYGGLGALEQYTQGKGLHAFNFEQQADIIEDYFRWKSGLPLQWAHNMPGIGAVLEKYKNDLNG